ncbi:MAG: hypothetical protein CM15mP84_00660 [Cellvibrionales bacterium]|nr:MAG: hypothetical protein CM15mP84_00660 [Cellvibrionales bacterium]
MASRCWTCRPPGRPPPPDDTLSIALDATQDRQVADAATALREQAPTLKGFVNACGFLTQRVPTLEIAPDNWAESIEGNLTSAFTVRGILRH